MNEKKLKAFEKETLKLFKELADEGQYARALEVLRLGQATLQLCKRINYINHSKEAYGNII